MLRLWHYVSGCGLFTSIRLGDIVVYKYGYNRPEDRRDTINQYELVPRARASENQVADIGSEGAGRVDR